MHFIKPLSFLLLVSFLNASENSSLLSALKQEKLNIDRQNIELESDNLKYDWIEQIVGSYTKTNFYDKRSQVDSSESFSIKLDQPVFKSGGIYYAVKYAGANREFLSLSTTLSEQGLIRDVIMAWLSMKKYDLQLQRQSYLIQNAKIDIIRKKEQYESGFLDSSFLDSAILTKTALEKNFIDMESQRYSQLMIFKSLSDSDYMQIAPPLFKLVDKDSFLKNSLILKQQVSQSKRANYLKKMTTANYLPTVSIFAGYYSTKDNLSSRDTYTQAGLRVSMPLMDINRGRTIEIRQLEYLKAKIELQDNELEQSNIYQDSIKKIEFLNKKIKIVMLDTELYNSLLASTKELLEAGEKTIYDVDTLYNSKQTMILDAQIYKIDTQKILLELYAKMQGEI